MNNSAAQQNFDNDYLYIRKELVGGRNPFVTAQGMKDWIHSRVDALVFDMVKERWKRVTSSMEGERADRELEHYHAGQRWAGEKEDGEDD
jgi:hypothetical protein